MFLLGDQLNLSIKEVKGLQAVSLFITTTYVKPWMQCSLAAKAPYQDLCFVKALKSFEYVEKTISEAALKKFCQHLYYFNEEVVMLSLFDDSVDIQTKMNMVDSLTNESRYANDKRYVPSNC